MISTEVADRGVSDRGEGYGCVFTSYYVTVLKFKLKLSCVPVIIGDMTHREAVVFTWWTTPPSSRCPRPMSDSEDQ